MQGRQLRLASPLVMAIINVTPDSFSDTEHRMDVPSVVAAASEALSQGADIIDIGGCSTRPDSAPVSEEEELRRVRLGVSAVRELSPQAIISVDTFRARVAEEAIACGADIINDISGGFIEPEIMAVAGRLGVPYILTHTRAPQASENHVSAGLPDIPEGASVAAVSSGDIVADMLAFFRERIAVLQGLGVKEIILDPGYGFGKTIEQNYEVLRRQRELLELGLPVLAGISHKSMIYKPLGIKPYETLVPTSALNMVALQGGASILRVHEVREAVQIIKLHSLCQA